MGYVNILNEALLFGFICILCKYSELREIKREISIYLNVIKYNSYQLWNFIVLFCIFAQYFSSIQSSEICWNLISEHSDFMNKVK